MKGLLYDTSVYIQSWRDPTVAATALSNENPTTFVEKLPVFLSSVVLEELYVGATQKKTLTAIKAIDKRFRNVNRMLTPDLSDWVTTGKILSKIGRKYGFEQVKLSRMTNDCLIAVSANRAGIKVMTLNATDFAKIAEFQKVDFAVL